MQGERSPFDDERETVYPLAARSRNTCNAVSSRRDQGMPVTIVSDLALQLTRIEKLTLLHPVDCHISQIAFLSW